MLWINKDKRRFYSAILGVDLFGNAYLEKVNGSLDSNLGRKTIITIKSKSEGEFLMGKIQKRRASRGYKVVR